MPEKNIDIDRDIIIFEDLNLLRQLLIDQHPTHDKIRLYSGIVRRLLLDGLIGTSARARGIVLTFEVPDVKPFLRLSRSSGMAFFVLGDVQVFGVQLAGIIAMVNGRSPTSDYPDKVNLNLESFLKQNVAFSNGSLLTRKDVIKYVANKAGGVHYETKPGKSLDERRYNAMGALRAKLRLGVVDGQPHIEFSEASFSNHQEKFAYSPRYIDAVYFEFLACVSHILNSQSVGGLMEAIRFDLQEKELIRPNSESG
ncbi:hypothetical protein MUG10_10635 [Xanthomonas prunicola]|uniref:Uncharacterized protein n=1 Tax=Xanthomonas prunicola TaxID=2053930 RepID=A0A9Q9IUB1_9XANT|nr:hypothetical protein [Xanthomonas prunicola]USJ02495.1 hypothetical protein MUG10_10635 [Xanthomonas prunicola]UXA51015.1 hypothetical protein M0D44_11355 [Xanthomonas prunicola]UXA55490.1 hypothetical protein M0D47_11390 [Xanthomonas prunicola]UXA61462.1 hypothetical protein M0D48_21675 [Xanthomonas prunicola]UXA63677.1 hypothetical protein M0D43_11615 [Xanthomonas prunicola]